MSKPYLPIREADLLAWTQAFASLITNDAANYGLTEEQSGAYEALQAAFASAYSVTQNRTTRTPASIESKNTAKEALVADTRRLVRIIQAWPGITNDKRAQLGITIPDTDPSPVPVPEWAPQLDIASVTGRVVKIRLRDAETGKRKKPEGVATATVLSYVGETIPESIREWTFEGNDSRLDTEVDFEDTVPTGSKVWLTAFWSNRRGESGPACPPVSTHLGFGVTANPSSDSAAPSSLGTSAEGDQAEAA